MLPDLFRILLIWALFALQHMVRKAVLRYVQIAKFMFDPALHPILCVSCTNMYLALRPGISNQLYSFQYFALSKDANSQNV